MAEGGKIRPRCGCVRVWAARQADGRFSHSSIVSGCAWPSPGSESLPGPGRHLLQARAAAGQALGLARCQRPWPPLPLLGPGARSRPCSPASVAEQRGPAQPGPPGPGCCTERARPLAACCSGQKEKSFPRDSLIFHLCSPGAFLAL